MPLRLLRDWTTSEKVTRLDAEGERLFIRLIMKADDFGVFYGDSARVKSFCFPLQSTIPEADIQRWLTACESARLIRSYAALDGRRYLQILDFRQRLRAMTSRFPKPPVDEDKDQDKETIRPGDNQTVRPPPPVSLSPCLPVSPSSHEAHIPTWEEVKERGAMRGIVFEACRSFYDHHEGNNLWLNRHGLLINWEAKMISWAARDRATGSPSAAGAPASPKPPPLFAQIKSVEALIEANKAKLAKLPVPNVEPWMDTAEAELITRRRQALLTLRDPIIDDQRQLKAKLEELHRQNL